MYSVFDDFISIPSWNSGHSHDRKRFMSALAKVVRRRAFDPDAMGAYLRANFSDDIWGPSQRSEAGIDGLVKDAKVVHEYILLSKSPR